LRVEPPALPLPEPRGAPITFDFEGSLVRAFDGQPVAVALHAAGVKVLGRSSKYHRPRGFFCLDGHCASCYLRIDGRPNRRACMTPARAGLRCERQNAFPSADVDLLRAADWLFPEGMDHHTLMTETRVGNVLFLKLVRQMGGSGMLPDAPAAALGRPRDIEHVDLCIVGGGPAGLAAARACAESAPGAHVALFDEQAALGGSLLAAPGGGTLGAEMVAAARRAGARLESEATAIAFFPEDGEARSDGPPDTTGLLAIVTPAGLRRVVARRYLYATGAYDQNLPFADNDRPGIVSARACGRLAFHHGVRPVPPGKRVLVLAATETTGAAALVDALAAAGIDVELVPVAAPGSPPSTQPRVVGARGAQSVRALELESAGETRVVNADLVAVATLPAPASELARQHGAEVAFDPARGGFAVVVDRSFRTRARDVFACGDVTGFAGADAAARAGEAAGRAIAVDFESGGAT
jgi:NADPH-dependent 2,4-dienoyl-CoA reductase/sulfur reductase-like enzyme